MRLSYNKEEKYTILTLNEQNLNSIIAPSLKSEFVILNNNNVKNVILDLTNVDFVDSSGLSSILTGDRLWKQKGSFILSNIKSESIRKLIEISRLDTILTIIPTVDEAVDYILMSELENELKSDIENEGNKS